MELALFPLPICILPGGFAQLRIFEVRYQRLVKESLQSDLGFGVCMLDEDKNTLLPIGTRCKIVDFETLTDGLLGITITGVDKFELTSFTREDDGLKRGKVTVLPSWDSLPITACQQKFSLILKQLLDQYPSHLNHYNSNNFNDLSWVCQRWLEVLPIAVDEKQSCIAAKDHHFTLMMLNDLLK